MLHKTQGIVLNYIRYSETSIITKIYTSAFGLESFIVNGVRKPNSRFPIAFFQPLNILNLEIYFHQKRNLQRIRWVECYYPLTEIPLHIFKTSLAQFIAEVLVNSIREQEKNEPLFNFLKDSILFLDKTKGTVSNYHLSFLIQFSRYLGFSPMNNYSSSHKYFHLSEGKFHTTCENPLYELSAQLSRELFPLLELKYETAENQNLNYQTRKNILDALIKYYQLHMEGFRELKSVKILTEVLRG